ncbi:MAG TPA: serine/threonine-protein kinase [Pyrinomonadaceae bacterium]|nr:serine/threonine-protein kinase [Pyrinomonadaceae bacterium]
MRCPACTQEIVDDSAPTCPSCGASVEEPYEPTRKLSDLPSSGRVPNFHAADQPRTPAAAVPPSSGRGSVHTSRPPTTFTSLDSIEHARFVAGTMLGERYRIVGLLGRGGMGEVYKAEDLRLGQMVALKFLPEQLTADGAALARFHREVRVARQTAHRNVCRVYDIGEAEGLPFLSMEYVRGEELSSVIKRFGRLPHDKALEVARQLCAGLAAAHEAGILHRDLKPGNVMIDERGDVRIMDFGLAGLAEEFREEHAVEGTPEYMSPEQFRGRELTQRSDIYSLGLILYELFTGRKAFKADSLQALVRLRRSETLPEAPSAIVRDLDPLVERVILRCIAADPKDRPAGALQVAAALPGGDPLAAALAAGETPSPEMVAAAPKVGALKPATAAALLALSLAFIGALFFWSGRELAHNRVPLERSAQGLQERARELSARFGYGAAADYAQGFYYDEEYRDYVEARDRSAGRWDRLATGRPALVGYWYRQSPRPLVPYNVRAVTRNDPPRAVSGMAGVWLDTKGRLLAFYGVPEQVRAEARAAGAPPFDWPSLLREAGLESANLQPAEPRWLPPQPFDEQAAWEGVYPEQPDTPVRIEAAALGGRLVHFQVVNPWDVPSRQQEFRTSAGERAALGIAILIFVVILVGALLLARRNLRLGRGDRRGAFRLAAFVFLVVGGSWPIAARHVADLAGEFTMFIEALAISLLISAIFWLVYVALEPFLRRRWPTRVISWNRLLAGDYRNPLVGRDLLLGAAFGYGLTLLGFAQNSLPGWLGLPPRPPILTPLGALVGVSQTVGALSAQVQNALVFPAGFVFLLLLFTILLRREWAAVAVLLALLALLTSLTSRYPLIDALFGAASGALTLLILSRFGLLAAVFTQFFALTFFFFPMTPELWAWHSTATVFALAVTLSLLAYGFYTSLAGQPLFKGALDD